MRETLLYSIGLVRARSAMAAVIIALLTGGCSSVPDAMNPVEWYKDTRDWIAGDETTEAEKQAEAEAKPIPGGDKAFPNLQSVPARPPASTAAEREKMANTLLADRTSARYTDEQIRRQDSSVASVAPPPAPAQPSVGGSSPAPVNAAPPAITTAPATPVQPAVPETPSQRSGTALPSQTASGPVRPPLASTPAPPAARTLPAVPNQPIPVIPNQPVAVPPVQPRAAQPQIAQRVPLPAVPSVRPPPPPVLAGGNTIPSNPGSSVPRRPPVVNPSGGGPGFNNSPPVRQPGNAFGTNRAPPRFRNDLVPLQQPALGASSSLQPNAAPVARIYFRNGSARIGSRDRQIIRRVYNDYRARGGRIHIHGHASSRTRNLDRASHQLANFSISFARARAVAQVLEEFGVPPEAIVISAMSDHQPAFVEVMPAGEAGNRRAEIYFEN